MTGAAGQERGLFDAPGEPGPLTVTQLTREVEGRLSGIGRVRVEGEVSGLKRAASGHVYFDLKDPGARVSCAVWRSQVERVIGRPPAEGDQVVATGRLDVYAPRGSYSLIVEQLEAVGIGALLAKLEALKTELRARGWFDRARPLPALPRLVGVVTSRDGAALRDFLKTRSARWPLYPVRLCHAPVQGAGSAAKIAAAIDGLAASGVELVVVTRGGGSLEDLWAFNEQPVAEAIWRCPVPVVSGVGHETDTTLADLVADLRAHTPTDAAQAVIPDRGRLVERLMRARQHLDRALESSVEGRSERLAGLVSRLTRAGSMVMRGGERRLGEARLALAAQEPRKRIARDATRLRGLGELLRVHGERRLEHAGERVAGLARSLEAMSPLAVLGRGYSLARRAGSEGLLRDADEVAVGDEIATRLARGCLRSQVLEVLPEGAE